MESGFGGNLVFDDPDKHQHIMYMSIYDGPVEITGDLIASGPKSVESDDGPPEWVYSILQRNKAIKSITVSRDKVSNVYSLTPLTTNATKMAIVMEKLGAEVEETSNVPDKPSIPPMPTIPAIPDIPKMPEMPKMPDMSQMQGKVEKKESFWRRFRGSSLFIKFTFKPESQSASKTSLFVVVSLSILLAYFIFEYGDDVFSNNIEYIKEWFNQNVRSNQ